MLRRILRGVPAACFAIAAVTVFCTNPTSSEEETVTPLPDSAIDSLFDSLVALVQSFEYIDTASDYPSGKHAVISKDFASLRDGFATAPANAKANVGFIVSSILALNSSGTLQSLADSLDAYIEAMDAYWDSGGPVCVYKKGLGKDPEGCAPGLFRTSVDRHGLQGLASAVVAKTPSLLRARAQLPAFPAFLTFNYLQGIIDSILTPVLDEAIVAAERLEGVGDMAVVFDVDNDRVEVDVGDVYLVDAGLRLVRGACAMITAFDMDLFTSADDQTYSWIDDMYEADVCSDDLIRLVLRGDTLYSYETSDMYSSMAVAARVVRYNLEERASFLTMRSNNAQRAYQDLLAAPLKIEKGLAAIRAETDDQVDDIVASLDVLDLDEEMLDITSALIDEGISPALANKFRTPESLLDFYTELLSGPYVFSETIDSHDITITVDFSKGFTDPVNDLRLILPKYRWRSEAQWREFQVYTDVYSASWSGTNKVYLYEYNRYDRSALTAYIDSVRPDPYWPGDSILYLNTTFHYRASVDSAAFAIPLDLADDEGNPLTPDDIDSLIDAEAFLPYFDDYTMGGVFPGMTRAAWLDLIWQ